MAAMLGLFVRTFLVQVFAVPSPSMEPTLLVGDQVLVNKFLFAADRERDGSKPPPWLPMRSVQRGDVVVFKGPDARFEFVKRCVALPGETIALETTDSEITIPLDHYFYLGDHRDLSRDSRHWGSISRRHLTGEAWLIIWSFQSKSLNPSGEGIWGMMKHVFDRTLGCKPCWKRCLAWVH